MTNVTIDLPAVPLNTPPRASRSQKYDWDEVAAALQQNPGVWIQQFDNFTSGMFTWLRTTPPEPVNRLFGQLTITRRRGTLWMRWTPDGWTEHDQQRVDAAVTAGEGVL